MTFKKNKNIFLAIALLFILIGAAIVVPYFIKSPTSHITAKGGLVKTKEILEERYRNDTWYLSYVIGSGSVNSEGKSTCWTYYVTVNKSSYYEGLMIEVYSNGTFKVVGPGQSDKPPAIVINNWTIDSDEAYSTAMRNEKIKAFMNKYDDADVDIFSLSSSGNSGHPVWTIEWVDWGFMDDPHWAKIEIDATTGEVLYAEAHIGSAMTASTIYTLCILSIVLPIIVIIMVSVVYVIRKRKAKERSYAERKTGKEIGERDSEENGKG